MMNLLTEGIEKGFVIPTDRATKLAVDGLTSTYKIYQIKLDCIFYNDQNDRIATWISRYKSEENIDRIDRSNLEQYNKLIENFIVQSNPEKMKATQKNIETLGQQKFGIVLKDGRVIDGNRRFTCLRRLSETNQNFNYFEAVILDKDIENNAKQIKMLELQLQIGEEARVDYDPIDRLVGIYNDIVANRLLTVEEYAMSTNMESVKDVEKLVDISMLLVEFLEAINAPGKFYLARELNLNGPLHELYGILKRIKDEDRREQVKYAVFTNFLMQPEGDMTRFVRQLKKITKSDKHLDEFVEKETEITERVLDKLPFNQEVTESDIKKIRADEDTKEVLKDIMEQVTEKVKVADTKNKPLQLLKKVEGVLEEVDTNIFRKLAEEQLEEVQQVLESISRQIKIIEADLDI